MRPSVLALIAFVAAATSAHPVAHSVRPRAEITVPAFFQKEPVFDTTAAALPSGGALAYVAGKIGLTGASSAAVTSSYTDATTGITHVYATQTISGIPVANAAANVNIKSGRVISYGHSFVSLPSKIPSTVPTLSATDAVVALASSLATTVDASALSLNGGVVSGASFALGDIKATLKWYGLSAGGIELSWELYLQLVDSLVTAVVSASTGELLGLADHTSHTNVPVAGTVKIPALRTAHDADPEYVALLRRTFAEHTTNVEESSSLVELDRRQSTSVNYTYYVVPGGKNAPVDGGFVSVLNPANLTASPLAWHDVGSGPVAQSVGNNVRVVTNTAALASSSSANIARMPILTRSDFNFTYPIDLTLNPTSYTNGSATNLFYSVNWIHDLTHKYGFDEASGNFQTNNFGRGGTGNDAVIAIGQDYSGSNNANFATPADGSAGVMRMYPWTVTTPNRDGDLEHSIVFHEFCHGVSNRLTGGPSVVTCLNQAESGGMGEGWSDFCGYTPLINSTWTRNDNVAVGAYSYNNVNGVRTYRYSTSLTTNPMLYSYFNNQPTAVHYIGTIWATMLYEVLWNFIDQYGYSPLVDAGEGGNAKFFRLVLAAMKLQPCNPTFISARNAILQADVNIYGGVNSCLIWRGFAKRGLGNGATTTKSNVYTLPTGC